MQQRHLDWTQRQLECCLYWQGKARKELKKEIALFKCAHPEFDIYTCPEATGINITETMKKVGILLEWPPVNFTYQISLAAIKNDY